jgi:hypothetical protein
MAAPLGKSVLNYFDLRAPRRPERAAAVADATPQVTTPTTPPLDSQEMPPSTDTPVTTPIATPVTATPTTPTVTVPPTMPPLVALQRQAWPLVVYAMNVLGVVAKQWYDSYQRTQAFDLKPSTFILAVVVSAVSFPATYHNLQAESKPGLQLFLAVQNGFFWQTVLGTIMR